MRVRVMGGFRFIGTGDAAEAVLCPSLPALSDSPPLLPKAHKGAAALGKCGWVDESLITSAVKGGFVFA